MRRRGRHDGRLHTRLGLKRVPVRARDRGLFDVFNRGRVRLLGLGSAVIVEAIHRVHFFDRIDRRGSVSGRHGTLRSRCAHDGGGRSASPASATPAATPAPLSGSFPRNA